MMVSVALCTTVWEALDTMVLAVLRMMVLVAQLMMEWAVPVTLASEDRAIQASVALAKTVQASASNYT